jgi:hypothetical protein
VRRISDAAVYLRKGIMPLLKRVGGSMSASSTTTLPDRRLRLLPSGKFVKDVHSQLNRIPEFMRLKRRYDPLETFQSDWYRHYREMFDAVS